MLTLQAKQRPPALPLEDTADDSPGLEETELPRAVAPFDPDPEIAAHHCFDRMTGRPVPVEMLMTYREALRIYHPYHLHAEAKFLGGEPMDAGATSRRHIKAVPGDYIGKQANRWEEQFCLGENPEAQTVCGATEDAIRLLIEPVVAAAECFGEPALARASGVSHREVSRIIGGKVRVRRSTLGRLYQGVRQLESEEADLATQRKAALEGVRKAVERQSVRQFAKQAGIAYTHLIEAITGNEDRLSAGMLKRVEAVLGGEEVADHAERSR